MVEHDRLLAAEIQRLCRDMFGPELAAHPHYPDAIALLVQGMRGAGLVAELHPDAGRPVRAGLATPDLPDVGPGGGRRLIEPVRPDPPRAGCVPVA